jgi:hypothetical protein
MPSPIFGCGSLSGLNRFTNIIGKYRCLALWIEVEATPVLHFDKAVFVRFDLIRVHVVGAHRITPQKPLTAFSPRFLPRSPSAFIWISGQRRDRSSIVARKVATNLS